MIRNGLIVSAITLALMAIISIWAGAQLPADNIPVHWNADGVSDRFSDRQEAQLFLWIMPGSALLGMLLFALLPQVEPMRENLYKSRKAYNAVWIATMVLLLSIHSGLAYMMIVGSGEDMRANEFVRLVIAGSGILFIILGNYLPKTRQNWFLGVRTPWTLSSEFTWEKTHRLAGSLFLIGGFVCLISAIMVNGIGLIYVVVGTSIDQRDLFIPCLPQGAG